MPHTDEDDRRKSDRNRRIIYRGITIVTWIVVIIVTIWAILTYLIASGVQ